MSVKSGIAAAGVAIALLLVAVGYPIWEWRMDTPSNTEVWSYGIFGARHTIDNKTTGTRSADRLFAYDQLAPIQPKLAAAFQELQLYFILGIIAAVAAVTLSVLSAWKKLRGIFAGVAFLASCGSVLYASFAIVLRVPGAANGELPNLGRGFLEFRGTTLDPSTNTLISWTPLAGWIVIIAGGLALAWASADLWHVRAVKATPAKLNVEVTLKAVRAPAALPPPPVELTATAPVEPMIEEVFVIASSGLLIKHMSRSLMSDKDRDVVGSMISAISSFVREAFSERDGEVHEVTLGDHRFVMCNASGLVVAVLVTSGETEDLVHRLRHLLTVLRDRYGDRLEHWQGEPLEGIEDELSVLWEAYHLPPPPAV